MAMMYVRKSRLTVVQQTRLIEYFVGGMTARASAELLGIQANSAIRFFMTLRQIIASNLPSYELSGEVEVDESYFGGIRKGTRGRGAAGKVAVFGLLKPGWQGLYSHHSECKNGDIATHHSGESNARFHCLYGLFSQL